MLSLGLELDRTSTFALTPLRRETCKKGATGWWGTRSVYTAKGSVSGRPMLV
jgi:hypothetical protein